MKSEVFHPFQNIIRKADADSNLMMESVISESFCYNEWKYAKMLIYALSKLFCFIIKIKSKFSPPFQNFIREADANDSNDLTVAEFVYYVQQHEKKLQLTFDSLDQNRDGEMPFISRNIIVNITMYAHKICKIIQITW